MRSVLSILSALLLATHGFAFMVTNGVATGFRSTALAMAEAAKQTGTVKWYVPSSLNARRADLPHIRSVYCPINPRRQSILTSADSFRIISRWSAIVMFFFCALRFNSLKGYGFIVPDDGGTDLFVHQTEIQTQGFRSLADGEAVEFVPQMESNGRVKATKVTGPGGAAVQGAPFRPENNDYNSNY